MLKLLIAEINYFKKYLIGMLSLPIFFTLIILNDIKLFSNIYFLDKYFWSMVVGMGTYVLFFKIWSYRTKELHERLFKLQPITLNQISTVRWIFKIAPFLFVGIFIELLRNILPVEQLVLIKRINGQLGMLFLFLLVRDVVMDSWLALQHKRYDKRIIYITLFTLTIVTLTIGVMIAVSTSLIKPFLSGGEEIFLFIWGIILSIADLFIYRTRKLFLS